MIGSKLKNVQADCQLNKSSPSATVCVASEEMMNARSWAQVRLSVTLLLAVVGTLTTSQQGCMVSGNERLSPDARDNGLAQAQGPWWGESATQASFSPKDCLCANGLGYGPFRDGQSPDYDVAPSTNQITEDLKFVSKITKHIRIYGTKPPFDEIPKLVKTSNLGISVMQGIHLSKNEKENEEEVKAAVDLAHRGLVDSIVVGNEALTSSTLTKDKLINYIREVKEKVAPSQVPVSTAETWHVWRDNPDLAKEVDFVVAHFYPFWDNQPIANAAVYVVDKYQFIEKQLREQTGHHTLRIVIGETGWPSEGDPRGDGVVPSPQNQRRFFEEFTNIACKNALPFYYFEVFDEEWKWREGNSSWEANSNLPKGSRTFSDNWIGSSWGLYHSNGKLKHSFTGLLDQPELISRVNRDILTEDVGLSVYYDIGVDSSQHRHDWLSGTNELRMSYPGDPEFGAVFITVGKPVPRPRPWKDFSEFRVLSLDLKGDRGGETVNIGIMTRTDPATGHEQMYTVGNLGTQYRNYRIPLESFSSSHLSVPEDLKQLYVVVEFVFRGRQAEKVYATNIRYEPK